VIYPALVWAAPEQRQPPLCCELCRTPLLPENWTGWCRECSLLVSARLRLVVEERWRDLGDGEHVVSGRGRVARLLTIDHSHRYPRVSIGGEKVYLHHLVAEAWHGPRPDGAPVLHHDDDPLNPEADNLRFGSHAENAADARRNRRSSRKRH
jgi:HNH endonuclease